MVLDEVRLRSASSVLLSCLLVLLSSSKILSAVIQSLSGYCLNHVDTTVISIFQ